MKSSLRTYLIRLACLLLCLVVWKMISTDWVIRIQRKGGGIEIYYPKKNTPIWSPPRPSTGNENFADELKWFGSGAGPFLSSEGITISPNWPLIILKMFGIVAIFSIFSAIRGVWLVVRALRSSQASKNLSN